MAAWIVLIFMVAAWRGLACGPGFPNLFLTGGEHPLLVAPKASFEVELDRMNLRAVRFRAVIGTNSPSEQTVDADLADLRVVLGRRGLSTNEVERIVAPYTEARSLVHDYSRERQAWLSDPTDWRTGATNPPPRFPVLPETPALPREFATYWRGAMAWHRGLTNDARAAWVELLKLPAAERRYKSTWAAFMLGRSYELDEPEKAITFHHRVRDLSQEGFADSLGLAAASIGWEARVEFQRQQYQRAIELYLDQMAGGDASAYDSLHQVASAILQDKDAPLKELARHAECRQVITAYLIAGGHHLQPIDIDTDLKEKVIGVVAKTPMIRGKAAGMHRFKQPALAWLEAVEAAGVEDVESATKFAMAAYQSGNMDLARRWAERGWKSPLSQWLIAKLHLRDGRLDLAAAILAKLSRHFPVEGPGTNRTANVPFDQYVTFDNRSYRDRSPGQQIHGELGALRLARREYTEALDCLLRADSWIDAAYIADRVLTVDELKAYVDRNWPKPDDKAFHVEPIEEREADHVTATNLRHLLARRLARNNRPKEAPDYFPKDQRDQYLAYMTSLTTGYDTRLPDARRGEELWSAARLLREHGMEWIGTEVEPDWALNGGGFAGFGPRVAGRAAETNHVHATADEIRRGRAHEVNPTERFHYRYVAASIAWEAARLMPDNTDETARVLCIAGSWLKHRDPETADLFYKSLVRRCRRTAIGQEADRKRWFPELDDKGNLPVIQTDADHPTPRN